MASLSEAYTSEWVEQTELLPGEGAKHAPQPAWITALGVHEKQAQRGFCDASPFEMQGESPHPTAAPQPEPAAKADNQTLPEDEAYMRGFADGHAEAKRAGDATLAGERERLRDLRLAFRALDTAGRDALIEDLNATVLTLCQSVLGEYALDRDALKKRCDQAAKRLGAGPQGLTLYLNPATRAALDTQALVSWDTKDDPALDLGALRLTSADGAVRDGPEEWMRAISETLQT